MKGREKEETQTKCRYGCLHQHATPFTITNVIKFPILTRYYFTLKDKLYERSKCVILTWKMAMVQLFPVCSLSLPTLHVEKQFAFPGKPVCMSLYTLRCNADNESNINYGNSFTTVTSIHAETAWKEIQAPHIGKARAVLYNPFIPGMSSHGDLGQRIERRSTKSMMKCIKGARRIGCLYIWKGRTRKSTKGDKKAGMGLDMTSVDDRHRERYG